MSWMDSWSRPSKSQATPPPYYLTHPSTRYCHTCGRVISSRKPSKSSSSASNSAATVTPAKYCSARCRTQKPRTLDREIERAFVVLLEGEERWNGETIASELLEGRVGGGKGERRVVVPCGLVEKLVFGRGVDPEKTFGRRRNRRARGVKEGVWRSVDMESEGEGDGAAGEGVGEKEDAFPRTAFAGKVRPRQEESQVNGSVGGEKGWAERETEQDDDAVKRLEGQRAAEEKEQVKRAGRRLCVFGYAASHGDDTEKEEAKGSSGNRMCEVIMDGKVVEPSFAKGDWGIRWRES